MFKINSPHKINNPNFNKLDGKFNNFEKSSSIQFEAIRQGITANSSAFDRLEAKFHDNRAEILNFRADMKDMNEEIRRWKSSTELLAIEE